MRAAQAEFETDAATTTRTLQAQYHGVQVQLDRLAKGRLDPVRRESRRQELQSELNHVEQQLSERSALLAQTLRERDLKLNDIARNLPAQAALVDFIEFRRFDFKAKGTNQWKERRYAAYLAYPLAPTSTNLIVERVDLGEAAPINAAIQQVSRRMSAGQYAARDLPPTLQRLSDMVYAPLAKHLDKFAHLIVCPDGQLSRLPIEMLPHDGHFLVEEKIFSYVGSGREIARLESRPGISGESSLIGAGAKAAIQIAGPSLVMGHPDFDLDLSSTAVVQQLAPGKTQGRRSLADTGGHPVVQAAPFGLRALSRDYRGMSFPPLPGSEAEARGVAKLLGDRAVLKIGDDAREAALKAAVSPQVLHLSTHGFFLSEMEDKRANGPKSRSPMSRGLAQPMIGPGESSENPLVRCGIALAGDNHANQITNALGEDGLLTGLEASLLNLQGTELVILSACQTGEAVVMIGEGVMSLRRAFRIAGAQSVLASHWPISDKATTLLMTDFIRRWRSGQPRAEALRQAQLALLHSQDYSSPYFWAAFTLTGQCYSAQQNGAGPAQLNGATG